MKRLLSFLLAISFLCAGIPAYAADYETHWAAGAILRGFSSGLISGDTDGNFHPDRKITRAEFVTIIARRLNLTPQSSTSTFSDVNGSDWFYDYVLAATDQGIASGYPDNTFRPNAQISREDAVVLLCRAFEAEPAFSASLLRFIDFVDVSDYALEYLAKTVSLGLLSGYSDGMLRPQYPMTRAEAVVLCENFYTSFAGLEARTVDFLHGYPQLSSIGEENKINMTVKVNQPCKIYYMAVDLNKGSSAFFPTKEMMTTLLMRAERANTEYQISIDAQPNVQYNIFLLAVADDGSSGKIHTIKNVTPLPYTQGKGTVESPYLIYTAFQLDQIRNFPKNHFRLASDIVLTDPWTPIGSTDVQDLMFSGSLDGAGHKISNLYIQSDERFSGLFAYIFGGSVHNLLVDVNVYSKGDAGGIVGHLEGGLIENCTVTGLVGADSTNAGGIAGTNAGEIRNCLSAVYVAEAMSYAGGIAGRNTGTIENCLSAVHAVTADMYAGGIAGANFGGEILNCVAANMRTTDVLTANSGRITTNRYNGKSLNNFGYDRMISNTDVALESDESQDGIDVPWETLLDADFYRQLGWNMSMVWAMPQKDTADFLLPVLRKQATPVLEAGRTMYAPLRVYTVADLEQIDLHPDYHYLLANNITLPKSSESWTPLCRPDENGDGGFIGSLDGNGHTISGLTLTGTDPDGDLGFFASVGGGTVRNLRLENVAVSGTAQIGVLATENHGYIEHCRVFGKIDADAAGMVGGIVAYNYGTLEDVQSELAIHIGAASATVGGIAAQNEGFIFNTAFQGEIETNHADAQAMLLGGICGMNAEGYIYHAYSDATIRTNTGIGYVGGICGLQSAGELYKCSVKGLVYVAGDADSTVYIGGICGMAESGLIMHSFSTADVSAFSNTAYGGGIGGFSATATIQNTYATGTISLTDPTPDDTAPTVWTGGICGYNESGFINGSVALPIRISTNGVYGKICAYTPAGQASDVYAYANIACTGEQLADREDGVAVAGSQLKQNTFFFTPYAEGGRLGWSCRRYDGEDGVWTSEVPGRMNYTLPLLSDVPYQNTFIMPDLQ